MRFGDDRIAGGDRRGKIAAGNAIERQRKIIGPEHSHRTNRRVARANVVRRVDRRQPPRAFSRRGRGLPKLVDRPRHLDFGQPRLHRQSRLQVRLCANRLGIGGEPLRIASPESRPTVFGGSARQLRRRGRSCRERRIAIGPRADRKLKRQPLAIRRVHRPERPSLLCLPPLSVNQNRFDSHDLPVTINNTGGTLRASGDGRGSMD